MRPNPLGSKRRIDLGRKEAELERASEEELRHMGGGEAAKSIRQQKAKSRSKS